jgi:hypothetical protein
MIRVLLLVINKDGVLLMLGVEFIVFGLIISLRGCPTLRGK